MVIESGNCLNKQLLVTEQLSLVVGQALLMVDHCFVLHPCSQVYINAIFLLSIDSSVLGVVLYAATMLSCDEAPVQPRHSLAHSTTGSVC